ncbi:hypothetical protein BpHYR1_007475 [Brachionus plicatilis]|uniref:Uncharacterized protein n=1 Tax=Brachionus plicatilis TaxID=10195 RepID=A0A3M7Q5W3_BRAPC|nr:hypothetical protein BpHYR1_007475 [Brachionus plicatilis]
MTDFKIHKDCINWKALCGRQKLQVLHLRSQLRMKAYCWKSPEQSSLNYSFYLYGLDQFQKISFLVNIYLRN